MDTETREDANMNFQEARDAFAGLAKEFGIEPYWIDVNLNFGWVCSGQKEPLICRVSPVGYTGKGDDGTFRVFADDFDTLLEKTRKQWHVTVVEVVNKKVRDMAIAIIRATADHGRCTDVLLRRAGFSADDIKTYAQRAQKEADSIASNGPFKVVFGESNGGPDAD
jgi:hypothetical protein